MTDYTELVKALRWCDKYALCNDCPIFETCDGDVDKAMAIAAAAIEELQAEVKRLNMRCADCEYAASEWPEDPEHTKTPKRGEWIETEEEEWGIYPFKKQTCSVCDCKIDHTFMLACMDYFDDRDTVFHYCPNCGAKMREVQE